MRKVALAAAWLAACSTSVPPTNPLDPESPEARAPVAVSVAAASVDPAALPGFVSCSGSSPSPCRVDVTVTADASPVELQISADPSFAGATWTPVPAGPQPWVVPFDVPDGPDALVAVHVRLRSAAGNVSATFTDPIQRKSSAPTGASIGFPALAPDPSGGFYTNALTLPLSLSVSGATRMRVACDAADPLENRPWVGFNGSPTCVLVAGDGPKQIAASFMDEAGNVSSLATATVHLQQTPPPPPTLTFSAASGTDGGSRTLVTGATTALTSSASFAVQVGAASLGGLFDHLDASSSAYLPVTIAPDNGSVAFSLAAGDAIGDATNLLSVRVVDKAGNFSPPATVTVVQERPSGPAAPTGLSFFSRPGSIQVSWTASASTYATGYLIEYGPTPSYGGAGADQGASPISVGSPCDASGACRWVLTGLSNFQPEYLAVTPVSPLQLGAPVSGGPVTPQPVALATVGTLSTFQPNLAVAVADDRAYVVQTGGLQIVDLSNPAAPALLGKGAFSTPIPFGSTSTVAVRWPYAYVAGADGLYVFDVSNEAAPARVALYPSTNPAIAGSPVRPVVALALRWPRAYLHVAGRYFDVGAILDVVDVTNPASPTRVNWVMSPSYGDYTVGSSYQGSLAIVGTTAYFGTAGNSNVNAASVAGVTASVPPAWIGGAAVGFAYTASHLFAEPGPRRLVYAMENVSPGTLRVIDYTVPSAPNVVGSAPGVPNGLFAVAGGDVYLVAGNTLEVLDLADPSAPQVAGTMKVPSQVGSGAAIAVSGTDAVVVGSGGLAVLQAAHLQYPQARGEAPALGVLTGGGRIEQRGRIAMVPGNGVALYDVGDPWDPRMVASNTGLFASGNDYTLGYGFAGGLAVSGDLLFNAYATQCNSGSGLMAYSLGFYSSTIPGSTCRPCAIARTPIVASGCNPAPRYYGLAAHGGYLFAAKGGAGAMALDVYDLAAFASLSACAYTGSFPAGPAPAATFALLGEPRDVQVHRRSAFVAQTDGVEILDVTSPTAPIRRVRVGGMPGVSAVSARLGRCGATPCYHLYLSTTAGVRELTWVEGAATVTDLGTLGTLGAASAVLVAHDTLVQGHDSTAGLGFFDAAASPAVFRSYSTPLPGGRVYALGAAGRYVYANDAGNLVVQELQ